MKDMFVLKTTVPLFKVNIWFMDVTKCMGAGGEQHDGAGARAIVGIGRDCRHRPDAAVAVKAIATIVGHSYLPRAAPIDAMLSLSDVDAQ